MRRAILRELWQRQGEYVSGNEMAQLLGTSRVAVWKHIEGLKQEGYHIKGVSGRGYCLEELHNLIIAEEITTRIGSRLIGRKVIYLPRISSTNDECKHRLLNNQIDEGTVVIAGSQSEGKGRIGRQWVSPPGGLWFSFILKPDLTLGKTALLSLGFAVAVARAVNQCIPNSVQIKWPNDVMLAGRKLCGISLELQGEFDGTHFVVVGTGINVNVRPQDLVLADGALATSMLQETGKHFNLIDVLITILEKMDSLYMQVLQEGFTEMLHDFKKLCLHLGRIITVTKGRETITGVNIDIDETGSLVIQNHKGINKVSTGDVRVIS